MAGHKIHKRECDTKRLEVHHFFYDLDSAHNSQSYFRFSSPWSSKKFFGAELVLRLNDHSFTTKYSVKETDLAKGKYQKLKSI